MSFLLLLLLLLSHSPLAADSDRFLQTVSTASVYKTAVTLFKQPMDVAPATKMVFALILYLCQIRVYDAIFYNSVVCSSGSAGTDCAPQGKNGKDSVA